MKAPHSLAMNSIYKDRALYLMLLPGLVYFLCFKYLPMWGILPHIAAEMPLTGSCRERTRHITAETPLIGPRRERTWHKRRKRR